MKLHPTSADLIKIYQELARLGARAVTDQNDSADTVVLREQEDIFAEACKLSRYDPRLFHILIDYTYHNWMKLNPLRLRQLAEPYGASLEILVIFNFIQRARDEKELVFVYDYLARGFKPASSELYFLGVHAPASHAMFKAATEPLQEFLDWGFLGREKPIVYSESGERRELGHLSHIARINLASELIQNKKEFSIADYLEAIQYSVSRQQAIIDLKKCGRFRISGKGRGSHWVSA